MCFIFFASSSRTFKSIEIKVEVWYCHEIWIGAYRLMSYVKRLNLLGLVGWVVDFDPIFWGVKKIWTNYTYLPYLPCLSIIIPASPYFWILTQTSPNFWGFVTQLPCTVVDFFLLLLTIICCAHAHLMKFFDKIALIFFNT